MSNWGEPKIISIPTFSDSLGSLGVIEGTETFPFDLKRVYFLHNVPASAVRGSHAHKNLNQLVIAVSGSISVTLDDGSRSRNFILDSANQGLTIPPGYWRTLTDFSPGACALVLASEVFTPSDYIRDYDEFLDWARNK